VGLKADGSVVAVGRNTAGQLNVESWMDIIQVAAGGYHTVGLKADGSVVAVGRNTAGQLNGGSWSDIIQVAAGGYHTVGLKADGSVVAVGDNGYDQCSFSYDLDPGPVLRSIQVSPLSYDFGNVPWGQTSTAMFTISNVGGGELTLSGMSLTDALDVFSFTPPSSYNLNAGESTTVEVTFSPTAIQSYSSSLRIESNDPDEPLIEIPLSGTGVLAETTSEQVAAVINYIQDAIDTGDLVGVGKGNSADKKVNALINMIEAAGDLLGERQTAEGCQQLADIYLKVDGDSTPPDFVEGPATAGLASTIQGLKTYYGCE
jgi:hypothetical protein